MAYLKRELKALEQLGEPPGVYHVCVQHDDWCPHLHTELKSCLCDPDMVLVGPDGRQREIDRNGDVKALREGLRCVHQLP
jgi:hypothetical protein